MVPKPETNEVTLIQGGFFPGGNSLLRAQSHKCLANSQLSSLLAQYNSFTSKKVKRCPSFLHGSIYSKVPFLFLAFLSTSFDHRHLDSYSINFSNFIVDM